MQSRPVPMSYHGAAWTVRQEIFLQDMFYNGTPLTDIALNLGRSCKACLTRMSQILSEGPIAKYIPISERLEKLKTSTPKPTQTLTPTAMFSPTSCRAIDSKQAVSESSVAPVLSSRTEPSSYDKDLRQSGRRSRDMLPLLIDCLFLRSNPKSTTPPPLPPKFCQYCRRPVITICNIQQSMCSQCKSVHDTYATAGLLNLIQKIKDTSSLPWQHQPLSGDRRAYITQVEYKKHLDTVPPKHTTKHGIEERKRKGCCESLVNIAGIYGKMDLYTCISGDWSASQHDSCYRLTFAYISDNKGNTKLLPTLAVIAQIAQFSTEESIRQWIAALRQKV
ncbi:hypothetical protein BCR42DRAFT_490579 [Absidia repens]|uniref:Uncharacterized protein n=1 Tax=Absidia repens TaxID=90262 RepID=A0A1X2IK16_9FUNG|nr:hypothetical protein BCR42DRAFT_490579 [Absidia repens]